MAEEQAYQGAMDLHSGGSPLNAMDFVVRQILGQIATATVVLVKAVDPDAETVDVQPMVHQLDGYRNVVPHGIIHQLPYVRLQGGACAVIIDPQPGDIGLAVFASSDTTTVQANKEPSPPGSLRRFNWSDGIYIGGLLNAAPTQFIRVDPTSGITITASAGMPVTINAPGGCTISAPTVTASGDLHVTGALTTGPGSTLNGKNFDSHQHVGVATGSGVSGAPA